MGIVSGGGGGGPAAGSYLPVANASGVTVNTTTYSDTIKGSGKLTTLVFPSDQGALAIALAGDAFPRWVLAADANNGLWFGDGTTDPTFAGQAGLAAYGSSAFAGVKIPTDAGFAAAAARISDLSPLYTIVNGALPTKQLVSGAGAQITGRDAETITPFTGDGTNNAATCAIAISADNVTYSTVATISIAAALNLTGVLTDTVNARVPTNWYLKLTAVHGTIGLTTYY